MSAPEFVRCIAFIELDWVMVVRESIFQTHLNKVCIKDNQHSQVCEYIPNTPLLAMDPPVHQAY